MIPLRLLRSNIVMPSKCEILEKAPRHLPMKPVSMQSSMQLPCQMVLQMFFGLPGLQMCGYMFLLPDTTSVCTVKLHLAFLIVCNIVFDYLNNALCCVLFSFTAPECFIGTLTQLT